MKSKRPKLAKSQLDNLKFINRYIRYGDLKDICASTDKSRSTVRRHLSGTPYNEDTVSHALMVIRGRMRKLHKQAATVAALKP